MSDIISFIKLTVRSECLADCLPRLDLILHALPRFIPSARLDLNPLEFLNHWGTTKFYGPISRDMETSSSFGFGVATQHRVGGDQGNGSTPIIGGGALHEGKDKGQRQH